MFVLQTTIAVLIAFLAVIAYDKVRSRWARGLPRRKDVEIPPSPTLPGFSDPKSPADGGEIPVAPLTHEYSTANKDMQTHKQLYYKLHNLEHHPGILPEFRELLLALLSSTIAGAQNESEDNILQVHDFSHDALQDFLKKKDDDVQNQYEEYVARRKNGGPREIFGDKDEAKWWLKQAAPVKYVDGAWLGHINKISTPFKLRNTTKNAWQVMSEELGDGDLAKNHVHVYRELMDDIHAGLPPADSEDFIHPRHELNEAHCWKAAMAQLLISLFAHEFLPEALGFNMAYESLPLHLLKTIKELREVRLNAYYFELHICIDNADTGHAAMAMNTVVNYINLVERTDGTEAAEVAWRRVQAGYILAEGLPTIPESPSLRKGSKSADTFPRSATESALINIFAAKSAVAHKIHCNSRLKIGRRSLVDWLEPGAFAKSEWQKDFLRDLSNCKPWVIKGSSSKSKLVKELSWEGRMFGSFTQSEVEIVKAWIDEIGAPVQEVMPGLQVYYDFTKRVPSDLSPMGEGDGDILSQYPVISNYRSSPEYAALLQHDVPIESVEAPISMTSLDIRNFLPLWFVSTALLESLPSVPVRAADAFGSALIRVLRAQTGFDIEGPGVAGMEEINRTDSGHAIGIVELGLTICERVGLPRPETLKEAVGFGGKESVNFAKWMLSVSMRWLTHRDILVGMSWAFMELHEAMSAEEGDDSLMGIKERHVLKSIAERERNGLQVCRQIIESDEKRRHDFERGITVARKAIRAAATI